MGSIRTSRQTVKLLLRDSRLAAPRMWPVSSTLPNTVTEALPCRLPRGQRRFYRFSSSTSEESAILSAALRHVPDHGFTSTALSLGARDAGYLDASINLFLRGPFDLVDHHLTTQRLTLEESSDLVSAELGVGAKVRALTLRRLRANKSIIHRWQDALVLLSVPSNLPAGLQQLAQLSDTIWHLAGDTSVDSSWYTKRATLSVVYSSTELFMTTDSSPDFINTERFLDRRLEELKIFGQTSGSVAQWLRFTGRAVVNVARNQGVRI